MRLVPTRQTLQLTGLTPAKLREWTGRRALIPADVPPKNQGSAALYSWKTILILRLALTLKDKFGLELAVNRNLFFNIRQKLDERSLVSLWDHMIALKGEMDWAFVREMSNTPFETDAIVLRLNPHLEIISDGFAISDLRQSPSQPDLFPATLITNLTKRSQSAPAADVIPGQRQRRLA